MRALGFAGSVLLALGGSALSRQPIQALNNVPSGLANAAALLGTFLMIIAWIAVCRRTFVASDPNVSGLVGLAVLWSVPFLFLPPIFSDDAWVYAANSLIVANGDSPYLVTPGELASPISDLVHPNWREIPARYGPVHFLLSGALGVFTESPHLLVVGHRLLALGGLVGLAWGLARLAPLAGRRSADAVALVVLSPLVLGVGVASPHNDLVMTGLAFAGLGLASVGRHWTATLLLGAAVGIKPPVGLLVLVLACLWESGAESRARRLMRLVAQGVVVAAVPLAVSASMGWLDDWAQAVAEPSPVLTPLAATGYVTAFAWVMSGEPLAQLLANLLLGTALLVIGLLAIRAPLSRLEPTLRTATWCLFVLLMGAPLVQPWYLIWLIPMWALLALPRCGWTIYFLVVCVVTVISTTADSLPVVAIASGLAVVALSVMALLPPGRRWLCRLADVPGFPMPRATSM